MAVNLEAIRWASTNLVENVTYTDEFGVTTAITVTNKDEPTTPFKDTGAKFEEHFPRGYLNYMFYQYYLAFQDLETRVAALEAL